MHSVKILFRYSKKSGEIDTTMTGINLPLMKMWALNNTAKSHNTMVIDQETGKVIFLVEGNADWPVIVKGNLGHCTEYGIPLEAVKEIIDDRF